MNKKVIILCLVFFFFCFVNVIFSESQVVIENKVNSDNFNDTVLSMMMETDANSGVYEESKDSVWPSDGYTFNSSLSKCENGGELSYDVSTNKIIMKSNISDKCYVYFDKEPNTLIKHINGLYVVDKTIKGTDDLTYQLADKENLMLDNRGNLRYYGQNPNNYVSFNNELWRIIGIFENNVKIVSENTIESQWGGNDLSNIPLSLSNKFLVDKISSACRNVVNNWVESESYKLLNNVVYSGFLQEYKDMVQNSRWIFGTNNVDNVYASLIVDAEKCISCSSNFDFPLYVNANVGLMYPSDYSFASSMETCNQKINGYSNNVNGCLNTNWLYIEKTEWLLTINSNSSKMSSAYFIGQNGNINAWNAAESCHVFIIRPTLYLKESVIIKSGNGSKSSPYILGIN